jgi:hypothetical protein
LPSPLGEGGPAGPTSAKSDLLFPSDEFLKNVTWMRQLKTQEEKDEWDRIFEPISAH